MKEPNKQLCPTSITFGGTEISKCQVPIDAKTRLKDIRNTCNLCAAALNNIPSTDLPPGSYFRKVLEIALRRSVETNIYLLGLIDCLIEERYLDFWQAIQNVKPISGQSLKPKPIERKKKRNAKTS